MKRILALVLLLCGSAFAQSYHVYDVVWLASGKPAPNSPIRVCKSGATGTPCSPLATVYSDQALTQVKTQPFSTDSLGNYDFWVASPARYVVEYYPQGSPIAVHQILTAPVTSDLPPGQPGPAGQDGAPGAPGYSPSQIISGCGVGYTGGLNFLVGSCKYIIASSQGGTTFNITTNTALSGPAADPSLNRFDSIVADNTGALSIVAGIASANPGCPVLNATSQVQIFCYEVDAGATTPANITLLDIYHENAEWTCATSGATINCSSTVNPHTGTKDVQATNAVPNNFVRFTIPAGTIDLATWNDLIFNIASKANWAGLSLTLQWYNGTTAKCTPVTLFNGQFNFDSTVTPYQQVDVPTRLFNCNGIPVTRLQMTVSGTGTNMGWYLDDVYLQGGASNSIGSDFMKWQRQWNSTKQYKINDTAVYNNITYTAIVDNTNLPPSLNPLAWDAHSFGVPGVAGNLTYNCGTNILCALNTLIDGSGNITFPGKITAPEFDSSATTQQSLTLDPSVSPALSGAGQITFISNAGSCQISQNGGAYTSCGAAFGTGTVTSISFTSPISSTANPLTTTGTVSCPTCVVASSPGAGVPHFAGSTQTVTSSPIVGTDMTNNTVTSTQLAVVNTRRTCMMQVGDGTNTVASGDYSPFKVAACKIPYAATIVEIDIQTDAGTPSILLQRRRGASTVADLLSGALAANGTTWTCALTGTSGTCIDGTTSSGSITLSNTSLNAGDVIEVKSGTASTETSARIAVHFTVN